MNITLTANVFHNRRKLLSLKPILYCQRRVCRT